MTTDARARIGFDPVEFPHRYTDPRDIEVSALLAAALAYGRADLFRPKVDGLLQRMGPSPAAFVRELDVAGARELHAPNEETIARLLLEPPHRISQIPAQELRVPIDVVQGARHDVLLRRIDGPGERLHPGFHPVG